MYKVGDRVIVHWPAQPTPEDHEVLVPTASGWPDIPNPIEGIIEGPYMHGPATGPLWTVRLIGYPRLTNWTCRECWFEKSGPW